MIVTPAAAYSTHSSFPVALASSSRSARTRASGGPGQYSRRRAARIMLAAASSPYSSQPCGPRSARATSADIRTMPIAIGCIRRQPAARSRTEQGRGEREQDDEDTGGNRVLGRPRQQPGAPQEAQPHRDGGEPGPAAAPGEHEQGEVEQSEVDEQADRTGVRIADQHRRQEAADQAHDCGRCAMSQREDQGQRRSPPPSARRCVAGSIRA